MLPVVRGVEVTKKHILFYSVVLVAVSLAPVAFQVAGWFYGAVALVLGGGFLHRANRVIFDKTDVSAKKLFGYSILYLFLLFGALAVEALAKS